MTNIAWGFPKDRLPQYQEFAETLIEKNTAVAHHFISSSQELEDLAPDILITNQYDWIFNYATTSKKLQWIHFMSAGVDKALENLKAAVNQDLVITNVRGIHEECMRNYIFSWILADAQHLLFNYENQKQQKWERRQSTSLIDKHLLIYGYGTIGEAIGKMALSLGMQVTGVVNTPRPAKWGEAIVGFDALGEHIAQADYIVIAAPLTTLTAGKMEETIFNCLENKPMLINISRSEIIKMDALKHALKNGKVRAAVLDVHDEEPIPTGTDVWNLENVYITPHISGFASAGLNLGVKKLDMLIKQYLKGEIPLKEQVLLQRGY